MFYVNQRWLGGTLTNFETIQKRIKRLKDIEKMQENGTFDVLPKKEVVQLKKELERLEKFLGGIKDMKGFRTHCSLSILAKSASRLQKRAN